MRDLFTRWNVRMLWLTEISMYFKTRGDNYFRQWNIYSWGKRKIIESVLIHSTKEWHGENEINILVTQLTSWSSMSAPIISKSGLIPGKFRSCIWLLPLGKILLAKTSNTSNWDYSLKISQMYVLRGRFG